MMEESLPRQHKRSFVFFPEDLAELVKLSVFLSSPFPWHKWRTLLRASSFMAEQGCRKSASHLFSAPLYLYFSPNVSCLSSKPPA